MTQLIEQIRKYRDYALLSDLTYYPDEMHSDMDKDGVLPLNSVKYMPNLKFNKLTGA